MRKTKLVTVSLPTALLSASERAAKKKYMTRSELLRTALRQYLESLQMEKAVRVFQGERTSRTLKTLKGSLADLMD